MNSFRPISEYAVIGNGRTAALISRQGSVDWCCWPRFDSPALFCRVLDADKGGYFEVVPCDNYDVKRLYVHDTNVLETHFVTESGELKLIDFMPAPVTDGNDSIFPHRMIRCIECVAGQVETKVAFRPTFDFAQTDSVFQRLEGGWIATAGKEALTLATSVPLEAEGDKLTGCVRLGQNERHWLALTHGPAEDAQQHLTFDEDAASNELNRTLEYWRRWSGHCQYRGPYRDLVLRSALVLKLLMFQPTGGVVAAPTTSLPDQIGGERNWDYRYTWLRDAGLILDALQQLGYHSESVEFIDWLGRLRESGDEGLRVMYCVDGEPAPDETTLRHLSGYRYSRPVKIGNGATNQTQIDAYGHVIDAVVLCFERMPRKMDPKLWNFLCSLADRAARDWTKPDHGPWEMRGEAQHYLYSKLYCWVGLDRVARFARANGLSGNVNHWERQRDAVRDEILSSGFDREVNAFTQSFETSALDATALTIPLTGMLPGSDPRVISTIRRSKERLARGALVYRYCDEDGLPGHDSPFFLCSFWMVMALAKAGQHEEARERFELLCEHANDLGLLSEQVDASSGELLGNFPQGYTHLALIRAALHLADKA